MMDRWIALIQADSEWVKRVFQLNKSSTLDDWQDCLAQGIATGCGSHYLCKDNTNGAFPSTKWTFQHHAAYHSAPEEVVAEMVENFFPMSYKDGEGKTPLDHVAVDAPKSYKEMFSPKYGLSELDMEKLSKIETNFHAVINSRCKKLVEEHALVLPSLSVALELKHLGGFDEKFWCAIPGMYGGFSYYLHLKSDEKNVDYLETSSWCRVAGGSGQKHKCYENDWKLVEEGFV